MNYKYHHKVLGLLYSKKMEFIAMNNTEKTIQPQEILSTNYSAKKLAEELQSFSELKAREILSSLREFGCLNSRFKPDQQDVFFWITDTGISRFHEQYFKYKRKEQQKEFWILTLKMLFYLISTIGIITTSIYNLYGTKDILNNLLETKQEQLIRTPSDTIKSYKIHEKQ